MVEGRFFRHFFIEHFGVASFGDCNLSLHTSIDLGSDWFAWLVFAICVFGEALGRSPAVWDPVFYLFTSRGCH